METHSSNEGSVRVTGRRVKGLQLSSILAQLDSLGTQDDYVYSEAFHHEARWVVWWRKGEIDILLVTYLTSLQ